MHGVSISLVLKQKVVPMSMPLHRQTPLSQNRQALLKVDSRLHLRILTKKIILIRHPTVEALEVLADVRTKRKDKFLVEMATVVAMEMAVVEMTALLFGQWALENVLLDVVALEKLGILIWVR